MIPFSLIVGLIILIWLAIFAFYWSLSNQHSSLEKEIAEIEQRLDQEKGHD